jgi:hypothetical protein
MNKVMLFFLSIIFLGVAGMIFLGYSAIRYEEKKLDTTRKNCECVLVDNENN